MIQINEYNPVQRRITLLKKQLKEQHNIGKNIIIKYDKKCFITNLNRSEINARQFIEKLKFSNKGVLIIELEESFFEENIILCPNVVYAETGIVELDSIIKRMSAIFNFGYISDERLTEEEINLCDNIFKTIYTKSLKIKEKNINKSIERFNNIQKDKFVNKFIVKGIIYMIYQYYNSKYLI